MFHSGIKKITSRMVQTIYTLRTGKACQKRVMELLQNVTYIFPTAGRVSFFYPRCLFLTSSRMEASSNIPSCSSIQPSFRLFNKFLPGMWLRNILPASLPACQLDLDRMRRKC
jgi:hypothetical protein